MTRYRKFNNEYRVWQGSDFDLEDALQDGLNHIGEFELADVLNEHYGAVTVKAYFASPSVFVFKPNVETYIKLLEFAKKMGSFDGKNPATIETSREAEIKSHSHQTLTCQMQH